MTQPLPPDVEAIVLAYLLTVTAVTDVFTAEIGTYLDGTVDAQPLPALSVNQVSTVAATHRRLTGYLFQLEVWAATKTAAFDAMAPVSAAMLDEEAIVGVYAGLGVVTGTESGVGPRPLPDPETGTPRYLHDVRVYARPE
jgi:hypothetical protein